MAQTVLYKGSSEYGRYRILDMIYEGRTARVLYAGQSAQSGVAHDDEPDLLFDYNQRFLEIALSTLPRSVLIIGGGTLTLPTALLDHFPDIHIDVVEIDPLLPELAKKFFDAVDDSRMHIFIGDGKTYIDTCDKQYDLIILDAFSEYDIPTALFTSESISKYRDCLVDTGIFAMNFIAKYYTTRHTIAHTLYASFSYFFEHVELYPADALYSKHEEQNIVLVASQAPADRLDYLQSVQVSLLTPRI